MHKIGTRIATIVLLLVVSISFSACSLFTMDLDQKYSSNINVATVAGDDIAVSRQELYYAYLQWGSQYASYYNSTEELLEYISTVLLNNKILEKQSIERFGALRDSEEALALKYAYQSLDSTLRSYIYETLNLEDKEDTTADEDSNEEVDKTYNPSILVTEEKGGRVYTMDLSSYADEDGKGSLVKTDYEFYVPTVPGVAASAPKLVRQAISKIIRNLQTIESGFTKLKAPARDYLMPENQYFKYLTSTERAVLNREIDRMVKANRTSILIDRINVAYNLGLINLEGEAAKTAWDAYLSRGNDFEAWCESINQNTGRDVASNIAQDAIDLYIKNTASAINSEKNFPTSGLEANLVSSGLADVYYIPQDVAKNLFTVSHILIGYTDEQKNQYNEIKARAEEDSEYNAENALNELKQEVTSDGEDAFNILRKLNTELDAADNLEEKYHIFREYINQYNSDPGMQNLEQLNSSSKPQYEYLMSSTAENNKMVEEFTTASIDLFKAGEKGAISELVWTDYGAHIIMYTRNVSDFIFTGVRGMEDTSIEVLLKQNYADTLFATLTSYGNRTLFDTLVDAYFTRSYSNYRDKKLNEYKSEHQVSIVNGAFKDFLKK